MTLQLFLLCREMMRPRATLRRAARRVGAARSGTTGDPLLEESADRKGTDRDHFTLSGRSQTLWRGARARFTWTRYYYWSNGIVGRDCPKGRPSRCFGYAPRRERC